MKHSTHGTWFAIAALAALAVAPLAMAQGSRAAARSRLTVASVAVEAVAASVTLPASTGGTLVMPVCAGCTPKSFQTTAETQYIVKNQPVSVATLHTALLKFPRSILTVSYDVNTGVVTQVTAAL